MTKAYLKRGKLIEARTVEVVYQRLVKSNVRAKPPRAEKD
jgi:hypothetical protein